MLTDAKALLKKHFGYDNFRDGQLKPIENILSRQDSFVLMPTGYGKSLCYQVPAMLFEGITIVISPLISLMKDQVDSMVDIGISAAFINSSQSFQEANKTIYQAKNNHIKLLYIAPERLESENFRQVLRELNIAMIAIDEAHCVSHWGHDFRTSYRAIAPLIDSLNPRPVVVAFTATATEEVKHDVIELLKLIKPGVFVSGFDRKNLSLNVLSGINKRGFILDYLNNNKESSGIIYASTRKEVESLTEFLQEKGFNAVKYHAGLSNEERTAAQNAFLYENTNIIVATNAFGMGIDKSNVRFVIHNNLPKNIEAYYQEAGRAGRDGEKSECYLLFAAQDVNTQKFLIEQGETPSERKQNDYIKLQEMTDYCHTSKCLRKYILEYFGDIVEYEKCENCSNCLGKTESGDITIEAQKIFSCIARMKEKFGTVMVANVLSGSRSKKVLEFGLDKLSTYNIMGDLTVKEIKGLINLLAAEEYLKFSVGEFPIVGLTAKAMAVLKGEEKVFQKIQPKQVAAKTDNQLFDLLRKVRKEISERENVPPYIVFSDAALKDMSRLLPTNEEEFLAVKGVGENKLMRYGEAFLRVIAEYLERE